MANFEEELMKEVAARRQADEERARQEQLAKAEKEKAASAFNQFSSEDQAALLNPDKYVPTVGERDGVVRRTIEMDAKNGSEDAKKWLDADKEMESAKKSQENIINELNRRQDPNYQNEAEDAKNQARQNYYEHHENRPHIFGREEWRKELERLDKEATKAEQHFQQRVERSSPEELGKLHERLEARIEQYQQAEATRQGIKLLPSEQKAVDQFVQEHMQGYMPEDYKKNIIQHRQDEESHKQKRAQVLA